MLRWWDLFDTVKPWLVEIMDNSKVKQWNRFIVQLCWCANRWCYLDLWYTVWQWSLYSTVTLLRWPVERLYNRVVEMMMPTCQRRIGSQIELFRLCWLCDSSTLNTFERTDFFIVSFAIRAWRHDLRTTARQDANLSSKHCMLYSGATTMEVFENGYCIVVG